MKGSIDGEEDDRNARARQLSSPTANTATEEAGDDGGTARTTEPSGPLLSDAESERRPVETTSAPSVPREWSETFSLLGEVLTGTDDAGRLDSNGIYAALQQLHLHVGLLELQRWCSGVLLRQQAVNKSNVVATSAVSRSHGARQKLGVKTNTSSRTVQQRPAFTVAEFVQAVRMETGWIVAVREHTAATTLQAGWRGYSCRTQMLEEH